MDQRNMSIWVNLIHGFNGLIPKSSGTLASYSSLDPWDDLDERSQQRSEAMPTKTMGSYGTQANPTLLIFPQNSNMEFPSIALTCLSVFLSILLLRREIFSLSLTHTHRVVYIILFELTHHPATPYLSLSLSLYYVIPSVSNYVFTS